MNKKTARHQVTRLREAGVKSVNLRRVCRFWAVSIDKGYTEVVLNSPWRVDKYLENLNK